ncbi:MAG: natural resistance-associated macrophage protein [Ilumatobacteraceae bacterium]|nr:natural resistance-associated macrophage protein [Ilumatobacteraceae bacterium]
MKLDPRRARSALRRRIRRALAVAAVLGPGLVAANAGNDAGGIATYASAGAQFGYRTLFVMAIVTVALVVVQEMAARLGATTGNGLVSLIREQFSLRLATFSVVCLLLANLGLVVSEFAGIGAAMELLGASRYVAVPLAAIGVWAVVVLGSYRYAERLFVLLSLVFLAYPISALLGHPHWSRVAEDTFIPHLSGSKAFLFLTVALIGTTITPYMQLYQAAAVVERGGAADDLRAIRIDSVTGSIFASLISMSIIIATAAAIGGRGPLASAAEAAQALEPVAGHRAETIFAIGLLGASLLAAAVVPLATSYALAEAIGAERSVSRKFRDAKLFLGLFTAQIVVGAAVALAPGNLFKLLVNTQFLNGLISPILLTFILVLANRKRLMGANVNGPVFRAVATVCTIGVSVLAAFVAVQTVLGWFGIA